MSHYDSLGLPQSASAEDIKKRYQRLILQLHPDKNTAQDPSSNALSDSKRAAKLQLVLKAWEVLRDQDSRTEYDASLAITGFGFETATYDRYETSADEYQSRNTQGLRVGVDRKKL
ncbi:hypothetical protein HDU81_007358 [Chytriomyces hyalinus]|nr:hypothetical protein HDU81_007358 [Chytriomyces hyalinus]